MNTPRNPRHDGFTLIELMICIAIMALLVGLLLPALALVRSQLRQVGCASNLRQVGLGYIAWSGEHQDKGVPTYVDGQCWDAALADEIGSSGVFWCPANPQARRGYDDSGVEVRSRGGHLAQRRSYSLISGVYTWNMWGLDGTKTVASTSVWWNEAWNEPFITSKRISAIPNPATVAIAVEMPDNRLGSANRPFNFWINPYVFHDNVLRQVHRGRDNYLMLDGHVEARSRDQARGSAGPFASGTTPAGVWTIASGD